MHTGTVPRVLQQVTAGETSLFPLTILKYPVPSPSSLLHYGII